MMVRVVTLFSLTALLALTGCGGVTDEFLNKSEKKLEELKGRGVHDSTLSLIKVYLYAARDAKARGRDQLAKVSAKSLTSEIDKVEATFKADLTRLGPVIDSLRSVIKATRSGLTGLQVKKLDSMMVVVDSLQNINWILEAHTKISEIGSLLPQFNADEAHSKEVRAAVPGEWVCTNITKSKEIKGVYAVEKKIFSFMRDGKVTLVENKKGQSGPFCKEDWEFRSWGNWDVYGDTIHLFINRFAAVRQNFERIYVENGKKIWKKEPQPSYDSTITDGSQNRSVTFTDLKSDFVR